MTNVYVSGVARTEFGKHTARSHTDLAREAVTHALADAQLAAGDVDAIVFSSCALGAFGQHSVRGPVVLAPLVREGLVPDLVPYDVEAACASGSVAFHLACALVEGGQAKNAVVVGVDKTFIPDMTQLGALFAGAFDRLVPDAEMRAVYERAAAEIGATFAPTPARLMTVDVCALLALYAMKELELTQRDLALPAALAHGKDVDDILKDKPVLAPFTRSMCTSIADGAACAIVSAREPASTAAVRVVARTRTAGHRASFAEPSVTGRARAELVRAVGEDGLEAVRFAEVHDATSYALMQAWGALRLARTCTINSSGGLLKRGHALAATGLAQIGAVTKELRASSRSDTRGLVHNAGGFAGLDQAVCALTLLERVG